MNKQSNETADEIDTGLQLHCATVAMASLNVGICGGLELSVMRQRFQWKFRASRTRRQRVGVNGV